MSAKGSDGAPGQRELDRLHGQDQFPFPPPAPWLLWPESEQWRWRRWYYFEEK